MPLAEMLRCAHGPGSRTLVASGRPSAGTVMGRTARSDLVGVVAAELDPAVADLGDGAVPLAGRLAVRELGQVLQGLDRPLGLLDLLEQPLPDQRGDAGEDQ